MLEAPSWTGQPKGLLTGLVLGEPTKIEVINERWSFCAFESMSAGR